MLVWHSVNKINQCWRDENREGGRRNQFGGKVFVHPYEFPKKHNLLNMKDVWQLAGLPPQCLLSGNITLSLRFVSIIAFILLLEVSIKQLYWMFAFPIGVKPYCLSSFRHITTVFYYSTGYVHFHLSSETMLFVILCNIL